MELKYKRILLKLSGEFLGGQKGKGFDYDIIKTISKQICAIHDLGIQVAIVVGGGNIFRGAAAAGIEMERVSADHMGMLATIINSICLQEAIERCGKKTRVMTGIEVRDVAEPYIKRKAVRHLEKGRIVIFGGGTGNPYFSTDTAAVLRGQEIGAEIVIKGTKVDGVYDKDPEKHADAKKLTDLTFSEILAKDLKVMDSTAISFCRDNQLPICILDIADQDALFQCIQGREIGTFVKR
ncbi:MAG: uridylate kinase [bacterium]|jgi:uridylate kinase